LRHAIFLTATEHKNTSQKFFCTSTKKTAFAHVVGANLDESVHERFAKAVFRTHFAVRDARGDRTRDAAQSFIVLTKGASGKPRGAATKVRASP
jgi:hypothetical protein